MKWYSCPVCVDMVSLDDPNLLSLTDHKFTIDRLQTHLREHSIREIIHFILEEADDVDNNYMRNDKE